MKIPRIKALSCSHFDHAHLLKTEVKRLLCVESSPISKMCYFLCQKCQVLSYLLCATRRPQERISFDALATKVSYFGLSETAFLYLLSEVFLCQMSRSQVPLSTQFGHTSMEENSPMTWSRGHKPHDEAQQRPQSHTRLPSFFSPTFCWLFFLFSRTTNTR